MIFSVNYQSKHKEQAGEIRCPYNKLGAIFDYIKSHPEKRINVTCGDLSSEDLKRLVEQVEFVKEVAENYTIECGNLEVFNALHLHGYNAYLRFPITDWETFRALQRNRVSDIYIDGPLGFQCKALEEGKGEIKIRISPTLSSNGALSGRPANSFFIRPEDLDLYLSSIDVIDFKVLNQEKEDALFSIFSRKQFYYTIDQLIAGLPNINNTFFKEDFAQARLNCGQRCMIPGKHCHYCEDYFRMAQKMFELMKRSD